MKLEFMLLESEGTIIDSKFRGHILKINEDKTPRMDLTNFEVVAILRPDYANRLLAAVGHQRSRIGVDFVNQPTVEAGIATVSK